MYKVVIKLYYLCIHTLYFYCMIRRDVTILQGKNDKQKKSHKKKTLRY